MMQGKQAALMQQLPHESISMIAKKAVLQQETAHLSLKKLCLLRYHYLTLSQSLNRTNWQGFYNFKINNLVPGFTGSPYTT